MRSSLFFSLFIPIGILQAQTPSINTRDLSQTTLHGRQQSLFREIGNTRDSGERMRLAGLLKQQNALFKPSLKEGHEDSTEVPSGKTEAGETQVHQEIQRFEVVPGSRANRILLTIANDGSRSLEDLQLQIVRYPRLFSFSGSTAPLRSIQKGSRSDVSLSFDVGYPADPKDAGIDTLAFTLKDRGGEVWTRTMVFGLARPVSFALQQNFPNPFNPSTTIRYQLPLDSRVSLKVYDLLGREVEVLADGEEVAGYHEVRFDAGRMASGLYFYRMTAEQNGGAGHFQQVRKLLLMK